MIEIDGFWINEDGKFSGSPTGLISLSTSELKKAIITWDGADVVYLTSVGGYGSIRVFFPSPVEALAAYKKLVEACK